MAEPAPKPASPPDRRPPPGATRARLGENNRLSFLRMVSHELRTPLNSIIGFSEVITRELYGPLSEPRYREHAQIIRDSGLKLLKLVNDVVELARLEAGDYDADLRPEDPAAVIGETVAAFEAEAAKRDVTLLAPPAEAPLIALVDGRAIRTVLANLVQNAVTHSPDGAPVEINVRASGRDVLFTVRDRGLGVAPDMLDRIQRPFEQGENALVRKSEGVGLGLATAVLLCKAMGGGLRLVSSPGEGLIAMVRVPSAGQLAVVETEAAPASPDAA